MVELKQIIGKYRRKNGAIGRMAWDMDKLYYNGEFMATINRVPGSPVLLAFASEPLSEAQLAEISDAIAKERGGTKPEWVRTPRVGGGIPLDDEDSEGEETEVDESSDE